MTRFNETSQFIPADDPEQNAELMRSINTGIPMPSREVISSNKADHDKQDPTPNRREKGIDSVADSRETLNIDHLDQAKQADHQQEVKQQAAADEPAQKEQFNDQPIQIIRMNNNNFVRYNEDERDRVMEGADRSF